MNLIGTLKDTAEHGLSRALNFFLVDLDEANFGLDKLTKSDFPVCICVPFPVPDEETNGGLVISTPQVLVYFMDVIPQATPDEDKLTVETSVIQPMRKLARQFITRLNGSELTSPTGRRISSVTHTPMYGQFDVHAHGVMSQFTWPIAEGTVC